jgi:hypothetical protein
MLVLRREWIDADMIAGPAWALEGRAFAAAPSTARTGTALLMGSSTPRHIF